MTGPAVRRHDTPASLIPRNPPPPGHPDILTRSEVAAWLKIKPRQVERLGIPCLDLGRKTKRYVREDVECWLQRMRKAG